ncbi:hypothetical protein A2U01_0076233, partial [Trifolium medium]|nr:hypothetical protein [Trifolium medium]
RQSLPGSANVWSISAYSSSVCALALCWLAQQYSTWRNPISASILSGA